MAKHARTSLLGLPRELRFLIYDHVRCLPTDGPLRTSAWLQVQQTCRPIREEILEHGNVATGKASELLHTYVVELRVVQGRVAPFEWLEPVEAKQIPCTPDQCRVIAATINALPGGYLRLGGDGGPTAILRDLFNCLRDLLQRGPLFDRGRKLRQPMHVERLEIHLLSEDDGSGHYLWAKYSELGLWFRRLNMSRILVGYVDQIVITDSRRQEGVKEIIDVHGDKATKWPENWVRYGYVWDVEDPQPSK
jgi:hypothetical protein